MASAMQKISPFAALADEYADFRPAPPKECGRLIRERIPEGSTIVDLGCGTGNATRQLAEVFQKVTGLDLEEAMLRHARSDAPRNITYIQADVSAKEGLPFAKESLDACTAYSSLHWFSDGHSLQNILNALKPGGYLFVVRDGLRTESEEKSKRKRNDVKEEAMQVVQKVLNLTDEQFTLPEKTPVTVSDLTNKGFSFVERVKVNEEAPIKYSVDDCLKYLKTFSQWNIVNRATPEQQALVEKSLRTYLATVADSDGLIQIDNSISMSIFQKPTKYA